MRRVLPIAAALALALGLAGSAQAAGAINTNVEINLFTPVQGNIFAVGSLSAGDERCVPDRTVEIYLIAPNKGPVTLDTARTADHGGWMGFRKASSLPKYQYSELKLVVAKKTVKVSKKKTITCAGKTRSFSLAG